MSNPITRRRLLTGGAGLLGAGLIAAAAPSAFASAGPAAPAGLTASDAHQLVLPAPTGPSPVGTVALHLVTPAGRELMISLWYPAREVRGYPVAPWLLPGAAERYRVDAEIPADVAFPLTHGHLGAPVDRRGGRLPVILYSSGNDAFRSSSTVMVEELASRGYLVVTIDHTGDAYVQFPDGRVLTPIPNGPETQWLAAARVADVRYVLDRIRDLDAGRNPDADHQPLPAGLRGGIDLCRVGVAGYSVGGATVTSAMYTDARISAGLSLDGAVDGPVVTAGLNRPYLLMTATKADRATVPELAEFWRHLRGWKRNVRLDDVEHTSYGDDEALVPQLHLPKSQTEALIGTADPLRVLAVQRAYPLAFFDLHLRHRRDAGHLLDGPSVQFPEVRFLR
jgi:dienelactone hydrolase